MAPLYHDQEVTGSFHLGLQDLSFHLGLQGKVSVDMSLTGSCLLWQGGHVVLRCLLFLMKGSLHEFSGLKMTKESIKWSTCCGSQCVSLTASVGDSPPPH